MFIKNVPIRYLTIKNCDFCSKKAEKAYKYYILVEQKLKNFGTKMNYTF